jgi:dTDP-glucose 4,6-dehydratase
MRSKDDKTILLTGAAGFVGHHTLAHLLKTTSFNFVVTDSFKHRGISARLRSVFEEIPTATERVRVVTHDLTSPIDRVTAEEFGNVNVIINMASESHVDRSISEPREFIENNIKLVLTLLDYACTLENLELFLQISTDEVYGPAIFGENHKEWETHFPSNPYSASKAAQENICFSYWRTFGLPMVITNTMNIVGERQDKEKFIPMALSSLIAGSGVPIHAREDTHGIWHAGSRYYLHARNQADALRHIITRLGDLSLTYSESKSTLEKFNVVGEVELKNDDLVRMLASFLSKEPKLEYVDFHSSRPGHDLRYALDGSRLREFGWVPPVPLMTSLERTVNWYLRNPSWLN